MSNTAVDQHTRADNSTGPRAYLAITPTAPPIIFAGIADLAREIQSVRGARRLELIACTIDQGEYYGLAAVQITAIDDAEPSTAADPNEVIGYAMIDGLAGAAAIDAVRRGCDTLRTADAAALVFCSCAVD